MKGGVCDKGMDDGAVRVLSVGICELVSERIEVG